MAADLSHSYQIERSWHLLTVLVRLGRPARPAELASHCNLTPSPSPDLVELLSSIPGSPLLLTDAGFVTVSESAVAALVEFVSAAIAPFVPRVLLRAAAKRKVWGDLPLIYVRKRKAGALAGDLAVPPAKRRLLLAADGDLKELGENDWRRQLSLPNKCPEVPTEVHLTIGNIFAKDILSVGAFTMGQTTYILKQESPFLRPLSKSSMVPRSIANIDHGGETNESEACDNTQVVVAHNGYKHGLLDNDEGVKSPRPSERVQITGSGAGPAPLCRVLDEPVLQTGTWREEKDFETAASSRDKATSAVPLVADVIKNSKVASAGTDTGSGDMARIMKNIKAPGKTLHQEEVTSTTNAAIRNNVEKLAHTVPFTAEPTTLCKEQSRPLENSKNFKVLAHTAKHDHDKNNIITKQKMKKSRNQNIPVKETVLDAIPKASKSCLEGKSLPDFESFTVEEEEGSGGYGTVYRARRKDDGKTFAIKCPHANANSHHINNELKMLERLGGRNFVIKYEGSFKSGDSECFVLEHVEHDRPEVLKKEIDVFELQWYGYCIFRALASLHKQGIVHRDVKPGNFLFSRKHSKGYLIDFNLANDLHKKTCKSSKSQTSSNVGVDPLYLSSARSSSYTQTRKLTNNLALDNVSKEHASNSKKLLLPKDMKKRPDRGHPDSFPSIDNKSKYGSQAADVSGVTSAKDPTSTRTLSADRLKQPIPLKGRKELINFVQEAMHSPNDKPVFPVSQRKRIAAPLGKVDRRLVMLTPMPLRSGGGAVAGAGMHKSQGNEKHKREGPCVGTKGFRAPEVLFKSCYQGCKVDIWSAGVTLLYMMIGRAPFGGDPEQNIKEIAKLRGSEDLWEVAKLHNCESKFPEELFDVQSVRSMDLRDWCMMNTKRADFMELIPRSLFDLIEKCLMVNPRRRISSEEALMHDFFTPCHESLRKQRLLRRTAESGSSLL